MPTPMTQRFEIVGKTK